jgi:hypothetical protein
LKNTKEVISRVECFLDNGAHKVHSNIGRRVFDTLAALQRRNENGIFKKNSSFRTGLMYKFDQSNEFGNPLPETFFEKRREVFHNQLTQVQIKEQLLDKLREACNGGTEEKQLYLKTLVKDEEEESSEGE